MGTVIIHGRDREIIREKPAAAAQSILEGYLLQKTVGADTWSTHVGAGRRAEPIYALEDRAGNVDSAVTAYADAENVPAVIGPRIADAWLQDGEVVVEGDALQSNGDGTLRLFLLNNGMKLTLVNGAAAGNHTVAGITTEDRIVWIGHATTLVSIASMATLTGEFTISAANTVENAGETDTSNDQLWVLWEDASAGAEEGSIVGYADEAQSPSGADVRIKVRRS